LTNLFFNGLTSLFYNGLTGLFFNNSTSLLYNGLPRPKPLSRVGVGAMF